MRGSSVLDRWCVAFAVRKVGSFGQFRGPVSKRGVDSGDGRLIGRLVACICRIQTVGCGWSIRDERGGKQRFDGSRQE